MGQLSSYINVYNTCLVILKRHGFDIGYDFISQLFTAKKDRFVICRNPPMELLGLAVIYWDMKPELESDKYWWRIAGPDIYSELSSEEKTLEEDMEDEYLFNTSLFLIKKHGFTIRYEKKGSKFWIAEKNGFRFVGDNPLDLLGLVAIYLEIKPKEESEYWWKLDEPNIIGEIWIKGMSGSGLES
jgi:hypothetical protein